MEFKILNIVSREIYDYSSIDANSAWKFKNTNNVKKRGIVLKAEMQTKKQDGSQDLHIKVGFIFTLLTNVTKKMIKNKI